MWTRCIGYKTNFDMDRQILITHLKVTSAMFSVRVISHFSIQLGHLLHYSETLSVPCGADIPMFINMAMLPDPEQHLARMCLSTHILCIKYCRYS